jgi:phage FluMu protein Com
MKKLSLQIDKTTKRCKICNRILSDVNKSGYCKFCLRKSPKIKEYNRNYFQRPEVKEKLKEYNRNYYRKPEVKKRIKRYFQEHLEERKEYMKEYNKKPEVKKRRKEYYKEYYQRRKQEKLKKK